MKCSFRIARQYSKFILLFILIAITLSGCSVPERTTYPELPGQDVSPDLTTEDPSSSGPVIDRKTVLTIAVPFGKDTAEMLRLLFCARISGELDHDPGNPIGDSIRMDNLAEYDLPLELILENVSPAGGAGIEQILQWQASATVPDIIYSKNAAGSYGLETLADLGPHLHDNQLFTPDNVYASLVPGAAAENSIYGVPYLGSVPLVLYDKNWLDSSGISLPEFGWSWHDFAKIMIQVQNELDESGLGISPAIIESLEEQPEVLEKLLAGSKITMGNPQMLVHWLPTQIDSQTGPIGWNGGRFVLNSPAGAETYNWIDNMTRSGFSYLHLDQDLREKAMLMNRQQVADRSIFLVINSSDLAWWHQQEDRTAGEKFLPAGDISWPGEQAGDQADENTSNDNAVNYQRTPVIMNYLAVSADSEHEELAAELAAFIALDNDSLLIQSRYQLYEGFFPAVRSQTVWNAMVSRQTYSSMLMQVALDLENITIEPAYIEKNWDPAAETAENLLLDLLHRSAAGESIDLAYELNRIDNRINQIIRED